MKNNIENGIYIPDDTRRLFTPTIVYTTDGDNDKISLHKPLRPFPGFSLMPYEEREKIMPQPITKDSSPEDLERWREYNRIEERRHDAEFVEYLKTKKQ